MIQKNKKACGKCFCWLVCQKGTNKLTRQQQQSASDASSSTAADAARTKCKHCGLVFESRNKLFIHINDGCPKIGPTSSKMKGKRKRAAAAVAVAPLAATTLMVDSKEVKIDKLLGKGG